MCCLYFVSGVLCRVNPWLLVSFLRPFISGFQSDGRLRSLSLRPLGAPGNARSSRDRSELPGPLGAPGTARSSWDCPELP